MRNLIVICLLIMLGSLQASAAEQFRDVPKDHWAAESVQALADDGIINGYPDGAFRGDQPVTRYEFAAALERFVAFFKESREPLTAQGKVTAAPTGKQSTVDPIKALKDGGFLPKDSPILKDPNKPVTTDQMAQALASIAKKMIADEIPGTEDEEEANEPAVEPQNKE